MTSYTVSLAGTTQAEAEKMVRGMSGYIKNVGQQTYDRMLASGYWKNESATPASTSNLGGASADLMKNQEAFIAARSADIDRDTQRGFQQGMSNMIASGLSGTTAVGGMQTGLTEAAVRAKAGVAADAQNRTDQLQMGYAGLAQQASEGAANRQTQMSLGQMSADAGITQSALSQPIVQQADTGRFESVIKSLQDEIAQLRESVGGMQTQGAGTGYIGQAAPSLNKEPSGRDRAAT